ncbi:DUF1398 domain-containing protein [Limnohabitans sp. Bal53]|jgi:uncharacterized protein YbcV (DUF1398 family)|uniref:DUF1398 domain-containing protein n=1 Tax=Limnohabitans sp. Bal53 TaxID=1977910 RepID=UPI000D35F56A|nr:DUF1398 domain-containing protein [Limnohabitans sp. Bal53]PUE40705.1 DUF1398 domain-containing protein [Limnohabitans sp. Bal53]
MNTTTILQLAKATQSGSLPFPEIVGRLIQEQVEYYLVDYRSQEFRFYGVHGGVVTAPLVFECLPDVLDSFDLPSLKLSIHDSQVNGQSFRDFSSRAMRAGVQSYCAFLRGQRVLYLGRQGDHHVEWFPGAVPVDQSSLTNR